MQIVNGDLVTFKNIVTPENKGDWTQWIYGINLTLYTSDHEEDEKEDEHSVDDVDSDANFKTEFTILHLIIICQRLQMLRHLIELMPIQEINRKVKVEQNKLRVKKKERWIFGATCIHLAAKFLPEGLKDLLAITEVKDKLQSRGSEHYKITPLHVACLNQDSISTRILLHNSANVSLDFKSDF